MANKVKDGLLLVFIGIGQFSRALDNHHYYGFHGYMDTLGFHRILIIGLSRILRVFQDIVFPYSLIAQSNIEKEADKIDKVMIVWYLIF
jgi:hypothetical protein